MIIDFAAARARIEAEAAVRQALEPFEFEFSPTATLIERLRAAYGEHTAEVVHIALEESK